MLAWFAAGTSGDTNENSTAESSTAGSATSVTGWDRYQIILDREPFGKGVGSGVGPGGGPGGGAGEDEQVPDGPPMADTVQLSVVSQFGGAPAAGFTDKGTRKSYYLFEGQSLDDYTLVAVDVAAGAVTLRKGSEEATLRIAAPLGKGAQGEAVPGAFGVATLNEPPAAGGGGAPAAFSRRAGQERNGAQRRGSAGRRGSTGAAGHESRGAVGGAGGETEGEPVSYAERQRRRVEEARSRRQEEVRRREEEARRSREEDLERLTGEALQKRLRELSLEAIRSGKEAPVPIELTAQEAAELAAEGFDVGGEPPERGNTKTVETDNEAGPEEGMEEQPGGR